MGNSIKIRLIVSSLVLFLVALGINVFLNSSSVDKLYEESKISHYRGIGEDLLRILTSQLNSGIGSISTTPSGDPRDWPRWIRKGT